MIDLVNLYKYNEVKMLFNNNDYEHAMKVWNKIGMKTWEIIMIYI